MGVKYRQPDGRRLLSKRDSFCITRHPMKSENRELFCRCWNNEVILRSTPGFLTWIPDQKTYLFLCYSLGKVTLFGPDQGSYHLLYYGFGMVILSIPDQVLFNKYHITISLWFSDPVLISKATNSRITDLVRLPDLALIREVTNSCNMVLVWLPYPTWIRYRYILHITISLRFPNQDGIRKATNSLWWFVKVTWSGPDKRSYQFP